MVLHKPASGGESNTVIDPTRMLRHLVGSLPETFVPIKILDGGQGNVTEIDPLVLESGQGTIAFTGDNCRVAIEASYTLLRVAIRLSHGSSFQAGERCRLGAIEVAAHRQGHVIIGTATAFTWHTRLFLHERSKIRMGADCLIASDTMFLTSDMHSILASTTHRRIIPAADIDLADRVWLGDSVKVMIIGVGSVVSGAIPSNCLAAGVPTRAIREGVTWDRTLIDG